MKIVHLPRQLIANVTLISIGNVLRLNDEPCDVCFDFSKVYFARPSGVVLMHNITRYLLRREWRVFYSGTKVDSKAHHFLDDIGFFEEHLKHKVWPASAHRPTTCRLIEVRNDQSVGWIENTFVPWLSNCCKRPVGSLAPLRTCVSEIFNNIRDHAGVDAGSIFAQWYPQKEQLEFTVGDFGAGIPSNVLTLFPHLDSSDAIVKAFEYGFSTKGNPRNRGAGLNFLRETVIDSLGGSIKVVSGGGSTTSDFAGKIVPANLNLGNSGYAGTLIEIVLPTSGIDVYEPEVEDEIW